MASESFDSTFRHPGDSAEQRAAEPEILAAAEQMLGVKLRSVLMLKPSVQLDGFCDGDVPVCVEAWAHHGRAIGSQPAKVMKDMCKLLLVERLLGKPCRKCFVVCDKDAVRFLQGAGWEAKFAAEFGIEILVVSIPESHCAAVRDAQVRQRR